MKDFPYKIDKIHSISSF